MHRHESEVAAKIPTKSPGFPVPDAVNVQEYLTDANRNFWPPEKRSVRRYRSWGKKDWRYLEGGLEWSGSSHGSDSATRWD